MMEKPWLVAPGIGFVVTHGDFEQLRRAANQRHRQTRIAVPEKPPKFQCRLIPFMTG